MKKGHKPVIEKAKIYGEATMGNYTVIPEKPEISDKTQEHTERTPRTEREKLTSLLAECGISLDDIPEDINKERVKAAIEKSIPQKVHKHLSIYTVERGVCPRCFAVEEQSANYCRACGQALQFEGE